MHNFTAVGYGAEKQKPWAISYWLGKTFGCYGSCCEVWTKSICAAVTVVAAPLVLGYLRNLDDDETEHNDELYFRFIIPGAVYWLLVTLAQSGLSHRMGADMIQERSSDVSLRDSLRTNLTNSGVVSALFLTMVLAMLQADPPFDETYRCISQWYILLLMISAVASINAVMMCSLCLMYVEPLNDKSAEAFFEANLMYFGEPLSCIGACFLNMLMAMVLWIFGKYGGRCGCMCVFVMFFTVMRLNVVYTNLSKWKNPTFSAEERKERDEYMRMLVSEAEKFDGDRKDLHQVAPSTTSGPSAVVPIPRPPGGPGGI